MNAQEMHVTNESHYHSKKDRIFVRAIQGNYNLREELARLRAMPRVRKGRLIKFVDGPQTFSRHYVEPKDGITQMFHLHLEEWGPGAKSQKHGHVNEAAFYILDGGGYEIHDGVRYDWSAGDVAIVHNRIREVNLRTVDSARMAGHRLMGVREGQSMLLVDTTHPLPIRVVGSCERQVRFIEIHHSAVASQ